MTLRNRILLIVLGTLVFITAGPALVLAARGYYYDWDAKELVRTGAVVVKSDPRGAAVFINDENRGDTPLVKRFTRPGEYRLSIVKPNYFGWNKKISVRAGEVADVAGEREKIHLLFSPPPELSRVATSTPPIFPNHPDLPDINYRIASSTLRYNDEILLQNLPPFTTSQILVSTNRQVFLLLDETLYQVGEQLVKINDGVKNAAFDEQRQALVYGNDHEIWLYNPDAVSPNELITRVTETIGPAFFHSGIGYVFYASSNKIWALHYDPAGEPNLYQIAQTSDAIVPLALGDGGTELQYYDAGELITLKIR